MTSSKGSSELKRPAPSGAGNTLRKELGAGKAGARPATELGHKSRSLLLRPAHTGPQLPGSAPPPAVHQPLAALGAFAFSQ